MANPARATAPTGVALDVLASAIAADTLSAELYEWADRVAGEAEQSGQRRIVEARVRAIKRTAGQLEQLARRAEQGGE